jgi:tetratricopeptide (TPR) repeat protein
LVTVTRWWLVIPLLCAAAPALAECRPAGRAAFTAGVTALSRGDLTAASRIFEELVQLQPECAEARNNLAAVLVEQGRLAEAADQLRQAVELQPGYHRARVNLQRVEALLTSRPAAAVPPTATAVSEPAPPKVAAIATQRPTPTEPLPTPTESAAPALPSSLVRLEPTGTSLCVVQPAQRRICVYRRTEREVALEDCYQSVAMDVRAWPRWLVAAEVTAERVALVDETARNRLQVIVDNHTVALNTIQLPQADFAALSGKIVPWRTAWVVQEPGDAVSAGERTGSSAPGAPVKPLAALDQALEQWRLAWEQKAYDEYVSKYSPSFVPQAEPDVPHWQARKRSVFERSGSIAVQVETPSVFLFERGALAITTFTQRYRAGTKASTAVKVLRWQLEDAGWQISAETVLTEEPLREAGQQEGGASAAGADAGRQEAGE